MENTDSEVDSQYPAREESQTSAHLRSVLFSSSSSDSQSEDPSSPCHSANQSFESSEDEDQSSTVLITRYQLNPFYEEIGTSPSPQRSIDDNGFITEKESLPSSGAALQLLSSTSNLSSPGNTHHGFKSTSHVSQGLIIPNNSPKALVTRGNSPQPNKSPDDLTQAFNDISRAKKYPDNIPQTLTSSANSLGSSKSHGNSPEVHKSPDNSVRMVNSLLDSSNVIDSPGNSPEVVKLPCNSVKAFKSSENIPWKSLDRTSPGNSPRAFEASANHSPVSKSPNSVQLGPNFVDETLPSIVGPDHCGLLSPDYPSQIPTLTLQSPFKPLSSDHSSPKTIIFNNSPCNLTSPVSLSKLPLQSHPLPTSQLNDGDTASSIVSTPPHASPKRNVSPSSAISSRTSDSSSDSSSSECSSSSSSCSSPCSYSSPGSSASPSFIQDDSLLTYLLDNDDSPGTSPVSLPRPLTIAGCLPLLATPKNSLSCNSGNNTPKSTVSTVEINSSPVNSPLSPVHSPLSPVHPPQAPSHSSQLVLNSQCPPTVDLEGEMQSSSSGFPPASTSGTKLKRKFWEHDIDKVKRQKTENESFNLIGIEVEYIKQNNKSRKDLTQIGCAALSVDKNGIVSPSEETFFRVIQPPGMIEYLSMKMKGDLLKSLHIQQDGSGKFEFRNEFEIIDKESNKIKCISEDKALEEVLSFIAKFNTFVLVSLDEAVIKLVQAKLQEASDQHFEPFSINNRGILWSQVLNNLNASSEDIDIDFEDWFVKNMNPEDYKIPQHPNALDISSMLIKAIKHVVEIKIKNGRNFYDLLARTFHSDVRRLNSPPIEPPSEDKLKFLEIFNSLRPQLTPTIYLESVDVVDLSSDSDNDQDQTSTISSILTNDQQEDDSSNIVWSPSQGSFNFSGLPGRQTCPRPSGYSTSRNIQANSSNQRALPTVLSNFSRGPSSRQEEGLLPTPIYPQQNLVQITISNENAWISPNQTFVGSIQPTSVCSTHPVSQNQGEVSEAGSGERNSQNQINPHVSPYKIDPLLRTRSAKRKAQITVVETGASLSLVKRSGASLSLVKRSEASLSLVNRDNKCRNLNKVCPNSKKIACSFQMCGACCRKEKQNEPCRGHSR